MFGRISLILLSVPALALAQRVDPAVLPPAVAKFCTVVLHGDIAGEGQRFNETDLILEDLPTRRIVDYKTSDSTSLLWYEHGGRGYHQHLVRFSTSKPDQILESYEFSLSTATTIDDLLSNPASLYPAPKDEL